MHETAIFCVTPPQFLKRHKNFGDSRTFKAEVYGH